MCIRDSGVGIEKSLLVRKWIERVRYSKKSIGVDFVVDGPAPEVDAGRTTGRDGDSARPLDGKSPMVLDSATAARSAGNRKNSTALRVGFRPGTTTRTLSDDSARTSERPNDDSPLGLSSPEGGFTYGGGSEI